MRIEACEFHRVSLEMWNRVWCEIDDLSCYDTMCDFRGSDGRGEMCNSVKLMILVVMMLYGSHVGSYGATLEPSMVCCCLASSLESVSMAYVLVGVA